MDRNCQDRLINITVWLIAELALNLTGFDNLADYSEFVFERNHCAIATSQVQPNLIRLA